MKELNWAVQTLFFLLAFLGFLMLRTIFEQHNKQIETPVVSVEVGFNLELGRGLKKAYWNGSRQTVSPVVLSTSDVAILLLLLLFNLVCAGAVLKLPHH